MQIVATVDAANGKTGNAHAPYATRRAARNALQAHTPLMRELPTQHDVFFEFCSPPAARPLSSVLPSIPPSGVGKAPAW
eukprot:5352061-Pleurochrysis_carterae.AAC.1